MKAMKRQAILLGIIAFFALIAIIFALVAANAELSLRYGQVYGPLIIVAAAVVICVLVFIVMKALSARAKRRRLRRRETAAPLYTAAAFTVLPAILRSKATLAVGLPIAALAGYLLFGQSNDDDG